MKFFIYFITTLIVPVICICIMQLFPSPLRYSSLKIIGETLLGGFLSVLIGTVVFSFFGLESSVIMVQLIGLFFFFNFFIGFFIKNESSEISKVKLLGGIGSLSGVIIGGLYCL